jgi:hypothetical protein
MTCRLRSINKSSPTATEYAEYAEYAGYAARVLDKAINSGRLATKETIDYYKVHRGLRTKSKDYTVYALWHE